MHNKNNHVRREHRLTIGMVLLSLVCALLLAPDPVYARAGPLFYDQFQVGDTGSPETAGKLAGEITAGCGASTYYANAGATVTCGDPTISDGMMQRLIYVSGGGNAVDGTYVQFILTEPDAIGAAAAAPFSTARGSLYFTNEDFVMMNNRGNGLANKLTLLDVTFDNATNIEQRYQNIATYAVGWANGTADDWVDQLQEITVLKYDDVPALATSAKELMDQTTSVKSDGNSGNALYFNHTKVDIEQRMTLEDDIYADALQKFKYVSQTGKYSTPYPTPFYPDPVVLPGGTNNGIVDWTLGEAEGATWVGYQSLDPNAPITFGYTEFENKSRTFNAANGNLPNQSSFTSLTDPEAAGPAPSCQADTTIIYQVYNSSTGQCDLYNVGPIGTIPPDTYLGSTDPLTTGGWNGLLSLALGGPLFGTAPSILDITTYGPSELTDYSVKDPVLPSPVSSGLDYIANSPALPVANPSAVHLADSAYNQWTVTNGVFTITGCPGDSCGPAMFNENGFYERTVVINGETYYQTIIVDGTTSGDPNAADFAANSVAFGNETFVKVGGSVGSGIAARTHLAEQGGGYDSNYLGGYISNNTNNPLPSNGGDFVQDVALNTGWANRGTVVNTITGETEPDAAIALNQYLFVPDWLQLNASPILQEFTMETGTSELDKRITLTSKAATRIGATYDQFNQPVNMRSVTVSGAYQQTARTASDPDLLPGANLEWAAGDALQATWIAAFYGTTPSEEGTTLNTLSFANRTTGERISDTDPVPPLDLIPTAPASWPVDPFLDAPTYP